MGACKGVLDKYIGDAMMAVWGVPFPNEKDVFNSCTAAILMIETLHTWNATRRTEGKREIQMGIGINTGEAISGNIGCTKRMEYTCVGDAVNTASRLEGLTKYYGVSVIVSHHTRDHVKDEFRFRLLDVVRVVGKKESVRLYEL